VATRTCPGCGNPMQALEINDAAASERRPLLERLKCPRCDSPLAQAQDLQHTSPFACYRCVRGRGIAHGRRLPCGRGRHGLRNPHFAPALAIGAPGSLELKPFPHFRPTP
jgi:endogenous inhibitor of DNA gyrase (YacG/DUF329 family)